MKRSTGGLRLPSTPRMPTGRVAFPLGPCRDVPQAPLIVALLTLVVTLAACGGPAPPAPARYPGDVLDLRNWYLTLPTGTVGTPDNVYPPELLSFSDGWFRLNEARDGVVFTADAGGATTKGSNYPRSELREMQGGELASEVVIHALDVEHSV